MPTLKNARHEKFAQELVKGKSQLDAYVAAGYESDNPHACRLAQNGSVVARVEELKSRMAAKVVTTVDSLVSELEEARVAAAGDQQHAASVSAVLGKAKLLGLIIDRREQGDPGAFDAMTEEQLEERAQKKIGNVVKLRVNEK